MHPIQLKIIKFLTEAVEHPVEVDDKLIDEFGEQCKKILRKQFTDKRADKFTLRMSNIGRPLCQLQMEKVGVKQEPIPYNMKVKFTYGDLIEALAMFIIKASGIKVQAEQVPVDLPIGGTLIDGTLDAEIDDAVFDVKSTSSYAFRTKFGPSGGFEAIRKDDTFGYVVQLAAYSAGYEKPAGGWIAINKESGEFWVTEYPSGSPVCGDLLETCDLSIRKLLNGAPFERCFTDVAETFRRRPTGNRVLCAECSYCPFKYECWNGVRFLPSLVSEA